MKAGLVIVLVLACSFSSSCVICDRFFFWDVRGQVRTAAVEGLRVQVNLVLDGHELGAEPGEFDELGGFLVPFGQNVGCDTLDEIPSVPLPDQVIVTVTRGDDEHVATFAGSEITFEIQDPSLARVLLPDIELPF